MKSKYDVMGSLNRKSSMNLVFLVAKVVKDLKQYEKRKITKDELNSRFRVVVDKGIPSIKAIANIGYENSKDLLEVDNQELVTYLKKENLSLNEFKKNYMMMINTYVKILLAFGIIEIEKIDIHKIMTPDVMMSLINGDFSKLKIVIDELGINISTSNKSLIDKLIEKDFDFKNLEVKEKELLDNIHSKYMESNVYCDVSVKEDKTEVLKYAKSLGKKKSVLEI